MAQIETQNTDDDRLFRFLKSNKANCSIFPNEPWHKVVTVHESVTLGEAFKQLIEHRILSLVVVDAEKKPVWILGLKHIVTYMLKMFDEEDFGPEFYMKILNWNSDAPHLQRAEQFSKAKLQEVMKKINLEIEKIHTMKEDDVLLDVVNKMVELSAHRIVIIDSQNQVCNLMTQSRIVSLIHAMELPKMETTIQQLNIGSKPVIQIQQSETAYCAFKLMSEKNVNGLAVVNNLGELVGNISISDIKLIGWNADFWNLMGFPIKEYLQQLSNHPKSVIRDYNFWTIDKPQHVILKCKMDDKLKNVLKMMCFYKVHRVYVVDHQLKPISIISMQDILKEITHWQPPISF